MLSPGLQAALLGNASKRPLLNLDFAKGVYSLNGAQYPVGSLPGWSFTRTGGTYAQDASGNLQYFLPNQPPITSNGLDVWQSGSNLQPYFENLANTTGWPVVVNATAAFQVATAPDGSNNASSLTENSANSTHYINAVSVTKAASPVTYTQSYYVKPKGSARNLKFSPNDGAGSGVDIYFNPVTLTTVSGPNYYGGSPFTSASASGIALANGWYRVWITFTTNSAVGYVPGLGLASGSSASYQGDGSSGFYIWGAGVETGSFATSPMLTGRNLLTYSGTIGGTNWTSDNQQTVTTNSILAPDNTVSGTTSILTANNNRSVGIQNVSVVNGQTYTMSVWAYRPAGSASQLDLQIVNTGQGQIDTFYTPTNAWVRYTKTFTATSTESAPFRFRNSGSTGDTLYLWGAQCELGSVANSYDPTTTASLPRGGGVVRLTPPLSAIQNPFILQVKGAATVVQTGDNSSILASVSTGSVTGAAWLDIEDNFNRRGAIVNGILNQLPGYTPPAATRGALRVDGALGFKGAFNGTLTGGASGSFPAGYTRMTIGSADWSSSGGSAYNGAIQSVALWPTGPDAQLQALTN